jgi:hypothetical protein
MRSDPGPGGTLIAEIDGYGIMLCLRRGAEGVTIVEHGGDYQGQHSALLTLPWVFVLWFGGVLWGVVDHCLIGSSR